MRRVISTAERAELANLFMAGRALLAVCDGITDRAQAITGERDDSTFDAIWNNKKGVDALLEELKITVRDPAPRKRVKRRGGR